MVDLLAHVIEQSGGGVALDMARSIGSNDVIELYLFQVSTLPFSALAFFFGWIISHAQQRYPLEFLAYTALMREIFFSQESI